MSLPVRCRREDSEIRGIAGQGTVLKCFAGLQVYGPLVRVRNRLVKGLLVGGSAYMIRKIRIKG